MRIVLVLFLGLTVASTPVRAQGVRGAVTSAARLIELRGLQADTIQPSRLVPDGNGGVLLDGVRVPCRPDVRCILFRPGDRQRAYTFTQDVRVTAWGFGVRGLSATSYLRVRGHAGDFVYPRADDAFDALIAYLEYDRAPFRVRLGRQTTFGGLGFSSYDGGSVLLEPTPGLAAELYGGRSLARGLVEPRSEALRGLDAFMPDPTVLLVGGAFDFDLSVGIDVSMRYQREIFADRSGLASERAAAEAVVTALRPLTLLASFDYDFAFGRFGKSDVRVRAPVAAGVSIEGRVRRYVPYFELWTIWGFFDPVAYNEAEAFVAWTDGGDVGFAASGAFRRYSETSTAIFGEDLERDTRRIGASAWWQAASALRVDMAVRRESGFGASYAGGDLSATWSAPGELSVRPWLTLFQQVEEFRIGAGSVVGGGLDASIAVAERWHLEGGGALYRNTSDRPDSPSWNQHRAWLAARVEFGSDPGLRGRR